MNTPVRYLPLMNGTAFMGMGPNTGLNEGKEYPYVLWEEYEALSDECARWRHDAQQLALRDRDQTALEHELAAERQQLATARQAVWAEAAGLWCIYCLRGDARLSWSHHTNGNVCAAERMWIAKAKQLAALTPKRTR